MSEWFYAVPTASIIFTKTCLDVVSLSLEQVCSRLRLTTSIMAGVYWTSQGLEEF